MTVTGDALPDTFWPDCSAAVSSLLLEELTGDVSENVEEGEK